MNIEDEQVQSGTHPWIHAIHEGNDTFDRFFFHITLRCKSRLSSKCF